MSFQTMSENKFKSTIISWETQSHETFWLLCTRFAFLCPMPSDAARRSVIWAKTIIYTALLYDLLSSDRSLHVK